MPNTFEFPVTFVDRHKGTARESKKEYDILTLSNGLRAGTVDFDNEIDTSSFKEGDKLIASFVLTLNYKNDWTPKVMALKKAK